MITEVSLERFIPECLDIPRFFALCEQCPNFGKRWSCPPYGFEVKKIWDSHTSILLYADKVSVPEELRSNRYSQDEINRISKELLKPVKDRMTAFLLKTEAETPGSIALSAGSCDICGVCSKKKGTPCLHPERMRYSIEALGGNVERALDLYFGEKIIWAEDGCLPEYYILLGGLLK
ncbi:MAG: hypothetical protein J6Z27_01220 [Bacteroidales bacterium]|nr:hypothetical protein [Bacteroidales bacterium]